MRVDIQFERQYVIFAVDNKCMLDCHWKVAVSIAKAIRRVARSTEPEAKYENDEAKCWKEGDKVICDLLDGTYLDLEPKNAIALGDALYQVAKRAEEWENAEQIAVDSGILIKAGAPFALTSNPKILDLTKQEIATNKAIRRMPGSVKFGNIKSEETFGTPRIIQD